MPAKKQKRAFDINNYQVQTSSKRQTVCIKETGDEFDITVKPLSWSKRNQMISKCLTFDGAGGTGFDGDLYVKESLKEMIVDAPWGRTTEAFLASIDTRLGKALEVVVPKAFSDEESVTVETDTIKKE